jgi:hypothetical protein
MQRTLLLGLIFGIACLVPRFAIGMPECPCPEVALLTEVDCHKGSCIAQIAVDFCDTTSRDSCLQCVGATITCSCTHQVFNTKTEGNACRLVGPTIGFGLEEQELQQWHKSSSQKQSAVKAGTRIR